MRGPHFFDENADMAQRRSDLKALTREEAWQPIEGRLPETRRRRFDPYNRSSRLFMFLTFNGHLLPFFSRFGNRIVINSEDRGILSLALGASEITYLSANRRHSYTVRHSKVKCLRSLARFSVNALSFLLRYNRLAAAYQDGYQELTSEPYWRRKLGLSKPARRNKAA